MMIAMKMKEGRRLCLLGLMLMGLHQVGLSQDTLPVAEKQKPVYEEVEDMPRFPGCEGELGSDESRDMCAFKKMQQYLVKKMQYPPAAIDMGISGTVFIGFVVNTDGSIDSVIVARSVHPLLDQEAMRVVQGMPLWKPGIQKGVPVRTKFFLPIKFGLRGKAPSVKQLLKDGRKQRESGDVNLSIFYFKEVIRRDVGSAEAYYELGLSCLKQSNQEKACEAFSKAAELGNLDAKKKLTELCNSEK